MIKFFRKIRQNLLVENKTGNYFKYAVGEIILVVIGILIAMSINNWNEQRKENIEEQALLSRLKKEFISNRSQLTDKIQFRNAIINNCKSLLKYYKHPENTGLDSILIKLSGILPSTFDPIKNDLVSSGTIEILKNEALKELLISWSTDVIQLQEVEQMFLRYYEKDFSSYLTDTGLGRDAAYVFWNQELTNLLESRQIKNPIPGKSNLDKKTSIELLSDPRLEGIITQSLTYNMFNNQESETLMKRINHILEVLEKEIKK